MICEGPDTVPAEVGNWYSPGAVAEMLAAERAACAKVRADKPRELPSVGTGALLGEQQFCFEKGWREGAASVRRNIAKRSNVLADRPAAHLAAGPATERSEVERLVSGIAHDGD